MIDNVDFAANAMLSQHPMRALVIDASDNMFILAASVDLSEYAPTSFYYYRKFAGSSTWDKGLIDIPELNNLLSKPIEGLYPFVPSTGNLMLQYFDGTNNEAGYVHGKQTDYFTSSGLSSDASLTSVLGETLTAGAEAGTSTEPKKASISVASGVSMISAVDIDKHDAGATVTFYGKDSTFTTPAAGSVNLTSGSETDIYIKVVAADSMTLYYKVGINRMAAISDFASTAVTSKTASFSWTAASGATGIVVEQSPAGANTWTTATTSGAIAANAASVIVTGLSPSTAYDFRLVVTGGTNAGTSNVVTNVTTESAPSTALTDFAKTGTTSTTATFSWTAANGATGLTVEQSPAGENTWTTATTSGAIAANAASATVTGLSPSTAYDFRLVVTGGANTGTSNVVTNVTTESAPTTALSDFAKTGTTSTTASFSWTVASGATGIVVEQSPAGANTWTTATPSGAIAANAVSATVTGLSPSTAYDFRLVVTGGANTGTSNVVTNVTTESAPTTALSDFAKTGTTSTTASFSWTAASGATGVVIEQSPAGANNWTTATPSGAIAANAVSATVTGLSPSTAYDFRLVVTGGTNAGTSNVVTNVTTESAPTTALSDFAKTGTTSTTASFSWTAANGATGIVVEQSPAGANTWTTATPSGAIAANAASATVTGLSPSTAYDFRLVVTGGTNAGTSNVVTNVTTESAPTTALSDFAKTGTTSTTASFSWTAASGATGIVVEQSPAGGNTWTTATPSGAIAANAASATVTGLSPSTAYDFRLVVIGGTNAGTSNVVTNVTTESAPSTALTDFAKTGTTSTTASFSWTAANGATGLTVEQSPAGENTWTTATTSGAIEANAVSATVTGLSPSTAYDFRLVVIGGTNAGTSNVVTNVTTESAPSTALTDFAKTGTTSTTASFSWTAANGATGIVVEQSPAGANTWTTATPSGAIAANAASATVTGLSPSTAYDFRLVVTGGTNAGTSNVVTNVTTESAPTTALSDFAKTGTTSTTASFSWTAASGATGIVVEQSPAGGNTWTTATPSGAIAANAASATVTGLSPSTAYDFRLVVTGGTNAGPSNIVTNVTTDSAPSTALTDFAKTAATSTTASFSWTAASGATGITVEQSPAGANTWTTATTSGAIAANAASATVTGLSPSTAYDFRLVVIGGTNAGTSNVVTNVTTESAPSTALTDFAKTGTTSTTASFSWTAANGATGLSVEQSPAGANNWTTVTTSGAIAANAVSATVTGLSPSTAYDFRLVVIGGTNAGTSNVVTNVTTESAPSTALTDFAETGTTSTTATFSWTAANGATGLTVEQSPAGANNWTTATTSGAIAANAVSATVTGLSPSTAYDFRLVVIGGTNAGTSNVVTNVTTESAPTAALTDFAKTATTSTTASFSWTAASGANGIIVEQSPAGANAWTTATTSGAIATNATSATVTGLSPSTGYDFRLVVTGGTNSGPSNIVSNVTTDSAFSGVTTEPVYSGSGNVTPPSGSTGVDILVNGKVETAGTATTSQRNSQTVTTISVDQNKLDNKLATEGYGAVVTLPVNAKSDIIIGELNGQMIKNLENYRATLEIRTARATYTLPAQQINIDALSARMGKELKLQDIKVRIEIATPTTDSIETVNRAAEKNAFTLVAPPTDFTISATYGSKTIDVSKFNAYVERTVALPSGMDPNKITTGVVVEPDGSVRHVPTKIIFENSMYSAQINSLTNSTYAVVWHPLEFSDVAKHWAKKAVNDMGSRMIVSGIGNEQFGPDQDITRAEFAAIIVRGLGLQLENGATSFSDVKTSDWYSGMINTAYAYHLLDGYPDGTFRPLEKITREEAMVILSKAMTLTGLKEKLPAQSLEATMLTFQDAAKVSQWAQSSVAQSVQAGIVSGRSATMLVPKANITRAEVATIIQKLLQKSELI
ncbi:fibronectin type III domain-containing protein [Paenibacillus sp. FSL R7-0204]|uniref:fibronectin type III domain-containing protein n=1 Tax=Paenibacillus sp. FSL R7-0204 TaxID=2921675 RepID=UPI0030F5015F